MALPDHTVPVQLPAKGIKVLIGHAQMHAHEKRIVPDPAGQFLLQSVFVSRSRRASPQEQRGQYYRHHPCRPFHHSCVQKV